MTVANGSCHCGNIQIKATLSQPFATYSPRACDCSFCQKHGAAYVSDANGELEIHIRDPQAATRYRQGSETAEFLFCGSCGILMAVTFTNQDQTFAAVNSRVLDPGITLGEPMTVSPRNLSKEEKTNRWQQVWFSKVIQK